MIEQASSPYINHFLQPDTLIPDPSNPQAWNRYSYVGNNPVNFNDPSGHYACGDGEEVQCDGTKGDRGIIGAAKIRPDDAYDHHSDDVPDDDGLKTRPCSTAQNCWTKASPVTNDPSSDILFWLESYDWLGLLDDAATWVDNYGRPIYKHGKGVVPGGFFIEAGLGALTTFIGDLNNPDLTLGQRVGRAFVTGIEDGVTEVVSTVVGGFAGGLASPGGLTAFAAYFGASYATTRAMDDIVWGGIVNPLMPGLFPPE